MEKTAADGTQQPMGAEASRGNGRGRAGTVVAFAQVHPYVPVVIMHVHGERVCVCVPVAAQVGTRGNR